MINPTRPIRTKTELLRQIQQLNIVELEAIDVLDQTQEKTVSAAIKKLNAKSGNVSVVVLRSR